MRLALFDGNRVANWTIFVSFFIRLLQKIEKINIHIMRRKKMRTDFDRKDLAEKHSKMEFLEFGFEVKQIDDGGDFYTVKGYASTFGNVDRGGDVVIKGAFRETLKDFMPSFLWMHKMDMPIGKMVDAFEDDKGLFIEARCPKDDTFVSGRVIPQMKIGSVATMSIGYYAEESEYDDDGNRLLRKVILFEVSPVICQ